MSRDTGGGIAAPRVKRGTVTILSIDGGGIRGLIPAIIVADIVRRVRFLQTRIGPRRRRAPPPAVHELFDIIAGTSTGALLALALTRPDPVTPQQGIEIYRRYGKTIFPPSRFASVLAMRQVFSDKYDHRPLETVLAELYGDSLLSETLSTVLVAAYNTDDRGPFFFKHYNPTAIRRSRHLQAEARDHEDFFLRDVARATTAAPTFFQPAQITSRSGNTYTLVDGGLVANNPALSAYVEARKVYRDARRYVIVSIGTGRSGRNFPHDTIRKWGYLDWVSPVHGVPLSSMMFDGQSESVAHALKSLPRVDYYRFNADITAVAEEMDDARRENIAAIEKMAREIIAVHRRPLHRLATILARRRAIHR